MERRDFLKKAGAAVAAAAIAAPSVLKAAESETVSYNPVCAPGNDEIGADFKILSDEVKDGVRYVKAKVSEVVCSKAIDLQIKVSDGTIVSCAYTGGCPGNTNGVCRLIRGMNADVVSGLLRGTPCGKRGTSCPDQLSRIIASLPALK